MTLHFEFQDGSRLEALEVDDFSFAGPLLVMLRESALSGEGKKKIVAGINIDRVKTFKVVGEGKLVVPITLKAGETEEVV